MDELFENVDNSLEQKSTGNE